MFLPSSFVYVCIGYYCTLGAEISQPTDNITGNICPEGHYCPIGSDVPRPCDIGYYLDAEGQSAESNCKICTKGKSKREWDITLMFSIEDFGNPLEEQ